jgi:NAD(P)-dependent dehydrogenase (short-subunit alcohol dehydrogenase family)
VSENPFNFAGKVALVTGGGRGIGRATSLLFARQGAKVVMGDIDPSGRETVEMIKQDGGEALFVRTDVREASEVKNLVAATVKTYGGLHCAFNNAGVLPTAALLADVEEAAFDQVVAVDLKGAFLSMKYEIEYMLGVDCRNDCGPGHQRIRGGEAWRDRIVESGWDGIRKSRDSDQCARSGIGGNGDDKTLVR